MKKNECVVFGFFDLVYLLTACLLARLLSTLLLRFANVLVPVSYHAGAILNVVTITVVSLALVGVLTFHDGYRYASFDPVVSLISAGAASLIHFGLGLATRFAPILFGPTRDLAGLISYGSFYNSPARVEQISFGSLAVVGIIAMLVYVCVMLLMNWLGCRKRLRDRAITTGADGASI